MRLLDYDPVTGLKTYGKHEDGKMVVYYEQDVEAEREAAQYLRNTEDHWNNGVKKDFLHYAHLTDVDVINLLKHGINIYAHDVNMADVFKYVNKNPHLKLVSKTHDKHSVWE